MLQTIHPYNFNVSMRDERFLKYFIVSGRKDIWDMIKVISNGCSNQIGCECGTMIHYQETCKILRNECSTSLPCEYPMIPAGHCCEMCGKYNIIYLTSFLISQSSVAHSEIC